MPKRISRLCAYIWVYFSGAGFYTCLSAFERLYRSVGPVRNTKRISLGILTH